LGLDLLFLQELQVVVLDFVGILVVALEMQAAEAELE